MTKARDTANIVDLPNAKGDLYAATAADAPARLAVGANNTVLTADSAEATGLKWAAAAGGTLQSQSFTSSTTWTVPTGVTRAMAFVVGGGGAGGGGSGSGPAFQQAGGGGGGRVYYLPITLVPGRVMTITVGAGGAIAFGPGGEGGDSIITDPVAGALITATGGGGGGGYGTWEGTTKASKLGTSGGAGNQDSSNYSTAGGGGGAAGNGQDAMPGEPLNGFTTFVLNASVATNGPKGGRAFTSNKWGRGGGGGAGINGFGGGGGGYGPLGNSGGADGGGFNPNTSVNAGGANTGGGGQGINTGASNAYGGAGGSGFIRLEWVG
jgi:hypothetical protein